MALSHYGLLRQAGVAQGLHRYGVVAGSEVAEEEVARSIGDGAIRGAVDDDGHLAEVLARLGIYHVAKEVCIGWGLGKGFGGRLLGPQSKTH